MYLRQKRYALLSLVIFTLWSLSFVAANSYIAQVPFFLPDSFFTVNETLSLKGRLSLANYTNNGTLVTSLTPLANSTVNLTIENRTGSFYSSLNFTTDNDGYFYSRSNYYTTAPLVLSPTTPGYYFINVSYRDANGTRWFSRAEIFVVNQTLDLLSVSTGRASYNPSENVLIEAEARRLIGDRQLFISNVSINGSIRNSTFGVLSAFNCTTGTNGRCSVNVTGPSSYGNYMVELENFKTFNTFSVVPFSYTLYIKDELGKSAKNVFALGEQASVEVSVQNASSTDSYSFSGYISDSSGNSVKTINTTLLNSTTSFKNTFTFAVDALTFGYKTYRATVTIVKSGDGNMTSSTSFEVKDWILSMNKRSSNSGFEYEYSVFPNKTMYFELYPTYRSNGSIIKDINITFFTISLKDSFGNGIAGTNATWNSTCGKDGCYEFALNSSLTAGQYSLSTTLSNGGAVQTRSQLITIITGVSSALPTDKDGALKELFGTNEYIYVSLISYNITAAQFNLTDAEVYTVRYFNGTEISYTQVSNWSNVNASNNISEWAWNSTAQRLMLDVPRTGGRYSISVLGNNRTIGTTADLVVNPYDVCSSTKDTPGTVSSGNYYIWQFKTTDTVYFELKITQANNPLGKAQPGNATNMSDNGRGAACTVDTTTKQVLSNATITVLEVRNSESGTVQSLNTTDTSCQSSDSSGGYSCTLKPLSKWDGGNSVATFLIQASDGTQAIAYGRFEARAFYIYGYSSTWQNGPSANISLTLQIYEAGGNWWGSSSGGLGGTLTLKKVEYMGRDGEWIWPPVSSGYNASAVNSTSITSGSGSMTIPVQYMPSGVWKTGYYRATIQATTTSGDTDYGYAWFSVKLWDVYGYPIDCGPAGCNYKSYYNSRENITLYVKVGPAGDYNYYASAGAAIGGNVSVGIKKITDCRVWPCKELNSSDYSANKISVNQSSPWYWSASSTNQSGYLLYINTTKGTWNTGYYSVVLDVNGTDTGYAWFNTIAFYIDSFPTDVNGTNYKYSIRGSQPMYFNVTTVKSYKYSSGSSYLRYNASDYVNTTLDSIVLRRWDQVTQKTAEYKYPTDINASPTSINGTRVINITYLNGSWPSGWYWGELTLKNAGNETSSGYLYFSARPFRVQLTTNTYNLDSDQCANGSLSVYDPDWYSSTPLGGNYSIINVYEDVWSGGSSSRVTYTNYTNSSFNATANVTFCPNSGQWGGGSWGGYHYVNVVVKDNAQNDTESGWLSFRTIPFQISWGSVSGGSSKATNANIVVPVTLTKSTGGNATGNITKLYQWRYDSSTQYRNVREEYNFSVGNSTGVMCWSNVSGQCTVNGTQNVTIYAPSGGWRVGYNYIYADWGRQSGTGAVQDWSGVNFEGRESYNGYFTNSDTNGNWKYYFNQTENITIKIQVRDVNYNNVAANITAVSYSAPSNSCYSESCRSYTSATWTVVGGGIETSSSGSVVTFTAPSGGWTKGDYYIKATISGSAGTGSITNGYVRVRDVSPFNITVVYPVNNGTYTNDTFPWRMTTNKNAQCSLSVANYQNFNTWYCAGWNATNSSNQTLDAQTQGACNTTLYPNYNGTQYYTEYVSDTYKSSYNGTYWTSGSSSTGLTTGGTTHTYTMNVTNWTTQYYGIYTWCSDTDSNYASTRVAFKVVRS